MLLTHAVFPVWKPFVQMHIAFAAQECAFMIEFLTKYT